MVRTKPVYIRHMAYKLSFWGTLRLWLNINKTSYTTADFFWIKTDNDLSLMLTKVLCCINVTTDWCGCEPLPLV